MTDNDLVLAIAGLLGAESILSEQENLRLARLIQHRIQPMINARRAVDNSGYAVHHINGNRQDHRLENLTLVRRECDECQSPVDDDGASLTECAAGRYGTDEDGCCATCGGCYCDGAC